MASGIGGDAQEAGARSRLAGVIRPLREISSSRSFVQHESTGRKPLSDTLQPLSRSCRSSGQWAASALMPVREV